MVSESKCFIRHKTPSCSPMSNSGKRCFTCASNLRSSVVYHLATSSGRLRCFGGTRPNACSRRACPSTLERTDNSLFKERQSSYPALAPICFTSMRCTKSCPRWNLLMD